MKNLIIVFFLYAFNAAALDAKTVILRMQTVYKSTPIFEYKSKYELFKGHKSKEITDTYEGYFCRNNTSVYQKIGHSEIVSGLDFYLLINHSEKAMMLSLAQQNMYLAANLDVALQSCSAVELETIGDYHQLVLRIKSTSDIPYSLIKLKISKDKYHLVQMDLYSSVLQDFSDNPAHKELEYPHLRISFNGFNSKPKLKSSLFEYNTYFQTNKNILTPSGTCKGYALIDNRLN